MGWAGGKKVFAAIIKSAKQNVKDPEARYRLYKDLIPIFEDDADCDTVCECLASGSSFGPESQDSMFDRAYLELNPDFTEQEEGCE